MPLSYGVAAVFIGFWVLILPVAARRMLGVHAGRTRLLLSGVAGVVAAGLSVGDRMRDPGQRPAFIVLFVGIGVLVAMLLLIVGEIVSATGARPRPLRSYRALQQWWRRLRRYSRISRVALRHGLAPYLTSRREPTARPGASVPDAARRLRQALEEAGVTFVKVGQILSTRHDLLPPEFTRELARLQNQVTPVDWPDIEARLIAEWGAPIDEVF